MGCALEAELGPGDAIFFPAYWCLIVVPYMCAVCVPDTCVIFVPYMRALYACMTSVSHVCVIHALSAYL